MRTIYFLLSVLLLCNCNSFVVHAADHDTAHAHEEPWKSISILRLEPGASYAWVFNGMEQKTVDVAVFPASMFVGKKEVEDDAFWLDVHDWLQEDVEEEIEELFEQGKKHFVEVRDSSTEIVPDESVIYRLKLNTNVFTNVFSLHIEGDSHDEAAHEEEEEEEEEHHLDTFVVFSSVELVSHGEEEEADPHAGHGHEGEGEPAGLEGGVSLIDFHGESVEMFSVSEEAHTDSSLSWEPWIFSFVAVMMMGLVSLSGVVFLVTRVRWELYTKDFAAISIGTMLGGALLSIFPETYEEIGFGIDVCLVVLAGVAFGFILETFIHAHHHHEMKVKENDKAAHEHVQDQLPSVEKEVPVSKQATGNDMGCTTIEINNVRIHIDSLHSGKRDAIADAQEALKETKTQEREEGVVNDEEEDAENEELLPNHGAPASGGADEEEVMPNHEHAHGHKHGHHHSHGHSHGNKKKRGLAPVVLMVLSGDGVHNFVDGALIGATFLASTRTGVLLTLAILAHELPQELGDVAAMLQAGLSLKRALLANFCSNLTALLGAALALVIGSEVADATLYVLPFAGGLFLYLALVSLMPVLLKGGVAPRQGLILAIGITVIGLLSLIPHSH